MGGASDIIYCVFPWQVGYFRSYGRAGGPRPILSPSPEWGGDARGPLEAAFTQGRRVWFPEHLALGAILERQAETYLLDRAVPVLNEWHGVQTRLTFWSPLRDLPPGPGPSQFAGGPTLLASRLDASPVAAGAGLVPLELRWQRDDGPGRKVHTGWGCAWPTPRGVPGLNATASLWAALIPSPAGSPARRW
jgi:hypothetical protein